MSIKTVSLTNTQVFEFQTSINVPAIALDDRSIQITTINNDIPAGSLITGFTYASQSNPNIGISSVAIIALPGDPRAYGVLNATADLVCIKETGATITAGSKQLNIIFNPVPAAQIMLIIVLEPGYTGTGDVVINIALNYIPPL